MEEKKLFLLDGHALVYRAHFAFINRPLINSKGINTSAITGFVRTLWDILVNQKPTHIAVAFDPSGPVFRHAYFPEYKANREEQPDDIKIALPYIKRIVEAFNIPIISVENYEADDAIGTISKQAEKEGFQVYMVTPDKDYAQLVSENIFMYKPSRSGNGVEVLTEADILEKWNISNVDQVIDVLGLQGDSSDNIPGVPGIGPKTAVKLLAKYHTLEGVLENSHELKGKQKENVETYAEQARISKRLATIDTNMPIQFDAERYIIEPYNRKELESIFKDLEFRTIAHQILGQSEDKKGMQGDLFTGYSSTSQAQVDATKKKYSVAKANIESRDHNYHLVDTPEKLDHLIALLHKHDEISFDTETTNINANVAELVGLVFSVKSGEAYYVPVMDDYNDACALCEKFKIILEHPDKLLIGHNIKYDALVMKWYGIELTGNYFDTMIAHYLCEPDLRHKLDYLSESYLDYKMVPITKLIGSGRNQITMREVSLDKIVQYAGEDADITLTLAPKMRELLREKELEKLYKEIELPLINVLRDMEYNGVRIDGGFLDDYSKDLQQFINDIEQSIYVEAGVHFNIASPKQVGEVLFDRMKIPYRWKKTRTGAYSTDVDKLTELAKEHELVNKILEFRKYAKLKNTYVDVLPLLINEKTGRIHSSFNQARAATGRLSSDNPNLQHIPIKNEAGRKIRKAFVPRNEDYVLLAADYSQIELRLIADISGDEAMMEAFIQGNDFHRATASKVFDTPYDDVTAEQRRMAKTVNFSITYGAGSTNLSRQLDISRNEASELIEQYFRQFPGLKKYMVDTVAFARKEGYVGTLAGRKRALRDINSKSGLMRSNAERMAINTPIQGSAADMIKIAMINIHKELKERELKTLMIMQVHDELVFDVYKPELEEVKTLVEERMKTALPGLKVPIVIGMDTGANWLEAH